MAFEDLNLSAWGRGSENFANGMLEAKTTKAKGKAAQMRGLESGIGTVIGALFGGYFGGLGGAVSGAQIGGGLASGDKERVATGLKDLVKADAGTSTPAWLRKSSSKEKADMAIDPGQMASALNMAGDTSTAMKVLANAAGGGDTVDIYTAASKLSGGLV